MSKNRIMKFLTFAKLNFAKKGYHNSHRGKTKNYLAKNIMAKMKWQKFNRKNYLRAKNENLQQKRKIPS